MTDTVTITLSSSAWTLVASSDCGTIENPNNSCITYRVSTSTPSSSVTIGHCLACGEQLNFSFDDAVNIYMRSAIDGLVVIYTEG